MEKGSVAIDGISLTVVAVTNREFSVSVIPHTLGNTTLTEKQTGTCVNLETDIVGKYVKKFTGPHEGKSGSLSWDMLLENGF